MDLFLFDEDEPISAKYCEAYMLLAEAAALKPGHTQEERSLVANIKLIFNIYKTSTRIGRAEAYHLESLVGIVCPFHRWGGQEGTYGRSWIDDEADRLNSDRGL